MSLQQDYFAQSWYKQWAIYPIFLMFEPEHEQYLPEFM